MAAISKQVARKFLEAVPEQYVFWCSDGRTLRNLKELEEALVTMTDDTFAYHSNEQKSDFASWVKDIIGDEQLADELRRAHNRDDAARSVSKRLTALKKLAR
ncbi:MAG: hypothetical protein V1849_04065 [Chloroflexota bacterium]